MKNTVELDGKNPEQGESEVNANQSFHAISPSHDKYPCEVNLRVEDTSSQVCHTRIENELEPQNDVVEGNGTRAERLQRLINQQNWAHLANDQQKQLSNVVLSHEKLFMLEKKDIGTISGEPAHIAVSDPNPCQSPMYLRGARGTQASLPDPAGVVTGMEASIPRQAGVTQALACVCTVLANRGTNSCGLPGTMMLFH
ncbi:hypothetical protein O3P69_008201 [Scylla paramamosain]|uniref:Uncharacterized protein n=1 Tax=Scylla paramamosain TaxID=85552 RepID=A0AAW0T1G0_SCYPA